MNFWSEIGMALTIVLSIYAVFHVVIQIFAQTELRKADFVKRRENAIEIYADADALEYYVRLALTVADGRIFVVAYLKKDSAEKDDMLDTVLRFRRAHKNLSYQWI
jgi:hypothetical protein